MNPPATRAWCRCRSHDFVRENERSGYKSSRTLQPSPRRRGHAMKHVLLPLAAAALLLAACGRDDDSVMSPDPAPPVEQTTPDDTMPEPMPPPVDDTMTPPPTDDPLPRSEEHTSELPSLMRHSYAVFCLKK